MKLTKWFDGRKFVPAHVGVYECGDRWFRYWNGEFWGLLVHSADNADFFADEKSASQNHDWRGLAENPNDDQKV